MYDSEDYIEVCGSLFTKEEYKKLMDSGKPKIPEKFEIYDNSIEWCCNGRSITDNEKDIMDKINEILDYLEGIK